MNENLIISARMLFCEFVKMKENCTREDAVRMGQDMKDIIMDGLGIEKGTAHVVPVGRLHLRD